ncbi:MAG: DUF2959 family protein [Spirochaetes bacterium]|nr:DUF2959 family protein [Spirochaetota bacterium]
MKFKLLLTSLACLIILGLNSCASWGTKSPKLSGTQQAEKASLTMELVEGDIKLLILHISTTNSALQSLVQTEQIDFEKAYADYVATYDATSATAEQFFANTEIQNQQIRAYFDQWHEQGATYTNPEVQLLSEQRLVELSAVYANIAEANVGVLGALNEYITTTAEIKKYLSTDLTTKGIDVIKPVAQSVIYNGISLKSLLELLYSSITVFRTELSPLAVQ